MDYMDINLDELPKGDWNWRPKTPPLRRKPQGSDKKFTARRRMLELQRELNRIEREFAL